MICNGLRTIAGAIFLLVTSFAGSVRASSTIHLIVAADTADGNIGAGTKANAMNVQSQLQGYVATLKASGEKVAWDYKSLTDKAFSTSNDNCRALKQKLASLSVAPDDVVIFYYAGHGYRTSSSATQFPYFYCSAVHSQDFGLSDVVQTLKSKNPRLTIAVADSCNAMLGQIVPSSAAAAANQVDRTAQLKKLLLGYKGVLILAGAKPGEFSWYLPAGGFFSRQLLASLDDQTLPGHAGTWDDVVREATLQIRIDVGDPSALVNQDPVADKNELSIN